MSTEARPIRPVEPSEPLRSEWIDAVDSLFRQVESWATVQGWSTHRRPTSITESALGTYRVWKLTVETPDGPIVFKPMARRVVGAEGLIDLIAPPSKDPSLMMVRHQDGGWLIHPFGDSETGQPWSEPNFLGLARVMLAPPA